MSAYRLPPRRALIGLLAALPLLLTSGASKKAIASVSADSAHDFSFTSIEGARLPLSNFQGKAVLLVNTASFCGFTHQYEDLQALWERYRDRGLVVLGVPSNDFGQQEPGSSGEIKEFCEVNFGINFPMTERQQVRGDQAHPLYRWIAGQLDKNAAPRWNFHKFLIAPDGRVVSGWPSSTKPNAPKLLTAIEAQLPS